MANASIYWLIDLPGLCPPHEAGSAVLADMVMAEIMEGGGGLQLHFHPQ